MSGRAPNILLLMSDQMGAPVLPIHGHPMCQAPHIEALADSGVVFDNAYCNYPLCAPARFSMLAGRLAPSIGAFDNAVLASNRTGAGGVTGSNFVVRSKPDGYTLLLARVGSQAGGPAINPGIPYKWNDFTFLGLLEKNPFVLAVNSESEPSSLADIEAKLKAGENLSYSSGGVGTLPHIAMVMVLNGMGMGADAMTHVPYKGGGTRRRARQ